MGKEKIEKLILPVVVIAIAALIRILPHIPNVTPIAAMALFGGVYLEKKWAFVLPLLAMLLSDLFLGFHFTMIFVYGSFAVSILLGMLLKKHLKPGFLIVISFISSIQFFLLTNFGVWASYDFYPKNINGLLSTYIMGVPFFRNTLLGDLGYALIFFGAFVLIRKYIFKNSINKTSTNN